MRGVILSKKQLEALAVLADRSWSRTIYVEAIGRPQYSEQQLGAVTFAAAGSEGVMNVDGKVVA